MSLPPVKDQQEGSSDGYIFNPSPCISEKNSFMGNFPALKVFDYEGKFLVNGIPISAAYFLWKKKCLTVISIYAFS